MALTHVTSIRNTLADAVVDAIDVGAGSNGTIQIATAAFASILVTIDFAATAFGAAASGTASALSTPLEANASATGTAAVFRVRDADDNEVFQGTVGVTSSGEDMELSSVGITSGDAIRINSFDYSAPQ